MKKYILGLCLFTTIICQAQPPLRYEDNQTPTYDEVMMHYEGLAEQYPNAQLLEMGTTDSGRDLHLFVMSDKPLNTKLGMVGLTNDKVVVLINNGIHPGESCGIDASIAFAKGLLERGVPENVIFAIIPVYNIGGSLNRGSASRANQDGPEEHGFRGNARNLDLNRDFIKADASNTFGFYKIFQNLSPHIFIDTHTSNGADYQYTMTLISTQKDKLNPVLADVLEKEIEPYLYENMASEGWEMTPYVNVFGYTPEKGFNAFLETPRYASGYTALFNTIGFITETHMLKPYKDRVESTLSFLNIIATYTEANYKQLLKAKKQAQATDLQAGYFDLNWAIDTTRQSTLKFKGYEYVYEQSKLGDYKRLKYLEDKPKTFDVPYRGTYKATDSVSVPKYYVLPSAWSEVWERLQQNGVQGVALQKDSVIEVSNYNITNPVFAQKPYEGHFLLKQFDVEQKRVKRHFLKGDYLIPTNQPAVRFVISVLEPEAVDSYLRWNFFDEVFQQKEYFSAYVFEDTAEQLLAENPALQRKFESWKKENPEAIKNAYSTLTFIYQESGYYEKEHLRYPVARIE